MSSSLFYDCYADYEVCPKTEHVDNEKSFSQLDAGDLLYAVSEYGNVSELTVKKPFKKWGGRYRITVNDKHWKCIDFGSATCYNAMHAGNDSIVYIDGYVISTNKELAVNRMRNIIETELYSLELKRNDLLARLEKLG